MLRLSRRSTPSTREPRRAPPPSDDHGLRADEAIATLPPALSATRKHDGRTDPADVRPLAPQIHLVCRRGARGGDGHSSRPTSPSMPKHAHEARARRTGRAHACRARRGAGRRGTGHCARRRRPPTSSVIGRYDSEGTSYVMYSDGSIEAAVGGGRLPVQLHGRAESLHRGVSGAARAWAQANREGVLLSDLAEAVRSGRTHRRAPRPCWSFSSDRTATDHRSRAAAPPIWPAPSR